MRKSIQSSLCPVEKTVRVIGGKWSMLLLYHLFEGKKRFGELQKSLEGISSKTLSQRLRELEDHGIITKKIFPEVPPHVEYTLTQKGLALENIFDRLAEWGKKY